MNKNDKLYSLGIRLVKQSLKKAIATAGARIELSEETKEVLRDDTKRVYSATCQSKMPMTEQIKEELQYISDNFDILYEDVYNELFKSKNNSGIVTEENEEKSAIAMGRKIIPFSEGQDRRIAKAGEPIKITPIYDGKMGRKCPPKDSKGTNGRQGNYDEGR